jgi:hypothetical protein
VKVKLDDEQGEALRDHCHFLHVLGLNECVGVRWSYYFRIMRIYRRGVGT